jgi:hypothetical protein
MSELAETIPIEAPLSEVQRVVDIFVAPTKTFIDLRRNAAFWGPLIIMIIVGLGFGFSIQQKVGWERTFENTIHQSPSQEEKIDAAPNSASIKALSAKITAVRIYGFFVFFLIITLIVALLNWATVNFGFGGTAKYSQIFAVSLYASLVMNIKYLLAIIALFAGLAPDSFLVDNPVGTNLAFYFPDWPLWLKTLCGRLDIFEIWSLVLTVIGVSIVAKVSRGKAAAVVVGWWVIFVLIFVGIAAVQS